MCFDAIGVLGAIAQLRQRCITCMSHGTHTVAKGGFPSSHGPIGDKTKSPRFVAPKGDMMRARYGPEHPVSCRKFLIRHRWLRLA